MSWRVVVVSNRCKLEYKLGYLVCRGEEVKKVFLSEIGVLIVESTAVSMTAALLCELVKNKIDVVFVMKNITLNRSCWRSTAGTTPAAV